MHPEETRSPSSLLQFAHQDATDAEPPPGRVHPNPKHFGPIVRTGSKAAHADDGIILFDDYEVSARPDEVGLDVGQVREGRGWGSPGRASR